MRKNKVQRISTVIAECLQDSPLGKKLKANQLIQSWEKVLGKNISEKTQKISIYGKTLYVEVSSAVLKHHLLSLQEELIDKLNEVVDDTIIEKIKIKNR